jgi:polysaccharide biosynthesis protein PslH
MKKILIITPYCPFPPHKSGGIHALFNLLRQNPFNSEIDLLYYDKEDKQAEIEVKKYVSNIYYIDLRKKSKFINRILSIINLKPHGTFQYNKHIDLNKKYDKIIFDQPLSIDLVDTLDAEEKTLFSYDSMIMYFSRKSKQTKNVFEKIYNTLQSAFYIRLQKKKLNKFDSIFYVSEIDKIYEQDLFKDINKDKFKNINLGVDKEKFNTNKYSKKDEKSIVFTGIMSYEPNKDAMIYFVNSIFNELKMYHQNLKLYIVGKEPDREIQDMAREDIIITGFVDDVAEYIANATVYISPLRFGTGMKNKVLEAMSTSKAIVASPTSVEGINELINGENIYVANNDNEWIEYINILIIDNLKREQFGAKCRKIIEENYSWESGFMEIFS